MTVRMIQVGLGMWGLDWATRVLPAQPAVQVVAWVDPDAQARDNFRAATGVPGDLVFPDLAAAMAATDPAAVLATVAAPAHVEVARQALNSGAHLLLEKPFTATVAEAEQLVRLAADRRLVLVVDQNYRYQPVPARLRTLLLDGALGTVRHAHVRWHRQLPAGRQPDLVSEISVHHFDLMRYIFDRNAVAVTSIVRPDPGGGPASALDALVELDGGPVVNYSASRVAVADETMWAAHWVLEADSGQVRWERADDGDELAVRVAGRAWEQVPVPPIPRGDRVAVLHDFVSAIERGTTPLTSGADNLHTVAIMAAVVDSASRGCRIEL